MPLKPQQAPQKVVPYASIKWPAYRLGPTLVAWRRGRPLEKGLADAWGLHLEHYRDIERRRQPPPSLAIARYDALAAFVGAVDGETDAEAVHERYQVVVTLADRDRATYARLDGTFWDQLRGHATLSGTR